MTDNHKACVSILVTISLMLVGFGLMSEQNIKKDAELAKLRAQMAECRKDES